MLLCFHVSVALGQTIPMTFNVDMNNLGLNAQDTSLNVRIKGDVEPLNWVTGIPLTDEDKDGIYSATIHFKSGEKKEVTFKYVLNDVEWELGDNTTIPIRTNSKPYISSFRYNRRPANPFAKFAGQWTLKANAWQQGYDNNIDVVQIPDHCTICKAVNTDNSMLCVIEAPSSRGHIFWSYNSTANEVRWLSSFYTNRSGTGAGSFESNGDLSFKVTFEGEPDGSYRLYSYRWISENEYVLRSVQYDKNNKPTGSYYGGTFVRVTTNQNP
jgi:hypothetical protein